MDLNGVYGIFNYDICLIFVEFQFRLVNIYLQFKTFLGYMFFALPTGLFSFKRNKIGQSTSAKLTRLHKLFQVANISTITKKSEILFNF